MSFKDYKEVIKDILRRNNQANCISRIPREGERVFIWKDDYRGMRFGHVQNFEEASEVIPDEGYYVILDASLDKDYQEKKFFQRKDFVLVPFAAMEKAIRKVLLNNEFNKGGNVVNSTVREVTKEICEKQGWIFDTEKEVQSGQRVFVMVEPWKASRFGEVSRGPKKGVTDKYLLKVDGVDEKVEVLRESFIPTFDESIEDALSTRLVDYFKAREELTEEVSNTVEEESQKRSKLAELLHTAILTRFGCGDKALFRAYLYPGERVILLTEDDDLGKVGNVFKYSVMKEEYFVKVDGDSPRVVPRKDMVSFTRPVFNLVMGILDEEEYTYSNRGSFLNWLRKDFMDVMTSKYDVSGMGGFHVLVTAAGGYQGAIGILREPYLDGKYSVETAQGKIYLYPYEFIIKPDFIEDTTLADLYKAWSNSTTETD